MANLFKDEFVPNIQGSSYHPKWVRSNPQEDAKWRAFRDAVSSYKKGDPHVQVPSLVSKYGKALVAAGELQVSVTDLGSVYQPQPEPPPPDPPPPAVGNIFFNADNETTNVLSQWSTIANGDVTTVTAQGGVTPVQGSRMMRCYVSTSNRASWDPGLLQASLIQKNPTPGPGGVRVGNNMDIYTGWSFYIVPGFQYAGSAHPSLMEYHGTTGMQQAPIHFGIFGNGGSAGQFFLDLHRNATGYSPFFQTPMGAMVTGRWIDCILRTKWSSASDGSIQFWMKDRDGQPMNLVTNRRINYNNATWNTAGVQIYLTHCIYRSIQSNDATVYFDNTKVGDTFDIVDPGRYS